MTATAVVPVGAVEPVADADGALVAEWDALAARLRASAFLHPGFVLAWWEAFGGRGQLVLITVRRHGRLAAALPLVRRGGTLASPANWHTPETAPLAEDAEAADAAADALLALRPRRLALTFLDRGAIGTPPLARAAAAASYRVRQPTLLRSPFLALEGRDWQAFEAGLSARTRASLRRRRRQLEQLGEVACTVEDGATDFAARFAEVVRVEGMGWKGEQGTAIASRPDTLRFYRAIAAWAAQRGWLRIHTLRLDGAAIAVALGIEAHGVHASLKIGFDPAHRRLGPGVLLQRELVEDVFARGLRRLDLLGDEGAHKRDWSSDARELIALDAWAPTLAGRLDRLARTARRTAKLKNWLGIDMFR